MYSSIKQFNYMYVCSTLQCLTFARALNRNFTVTQTLLTYTPLPLIPIVANLALPLPPHHTHVAAGVWGRAGTHSLTWWHAHPRSGRQPEGGRWRPEGEGAWWNGRGRKGHNVSSWSFYNLWHGSQTHCYNTDCHYTHTN